MQMGPLSFTAGKMLDCTLVWVIPAGNPRYGKIVELDKIVI
jgi:hypothetical protein